MSLIGLILDLGNIIFFLANIPQVVTAYRNRKNLRGLSSRMLLGYSASTVCFITSGYMAQGYLTVVLGVINILIFITQLYWKRKY